MIENLSIEIINSLTLSELDVLRFIDKNIEKIFSLSIQDLAKESFSSTATIIRLCKKLNFSGYAELKYALKNDFEKNKSKTKTVSFYDAIQNNINNITLTLKNLDEKNVNKIVDILKSNMNIYFFGKGLNGTILEYASKELLSHARNNIFFQDTHIAYLYAEKMNKNDCVILASLSGKTHQIIRMAQIAKSRGATIISLTGTKENDLAKLGDYHLSVVTSQLNDSKIDNVSRAPMLIILNIILETYFNQIV